jgi:hypothetical protein
MCVSDSDDIDCVRALRWDAQATIQRMNDSLLARGYITWFDLTNMKGSVMDAVSALFFFRQDDTLILLKALYTLELLSGRLWC